MTDELSYVQGLGLAETGPEVCLHICRLWDIGKQDARDALDDSLWLGADQAPEVLTSAGV